MQTEIVKLLLFICVYPCLSVASSRIYVATALLTT
jgi:hypothetical protein